MDKVDVRFPQKPKPAANLPKNAEERAVALSDLMERLSAHLTRETAAIHGRRHQELAELVKAKQPMVLVCEEVSRMLRIDRDGMAALPAALKTRLKAANDALNAAVHENALALQRMTEGQKLLVDTVVTAVRQAQQGLKPAYGPAAAGYRRTTYGSGLAAHGSIASAALNTTL